MKTQRSFVQALIAAAVVAGLWSAAAASAAPVVVEVPKPNAQVVKVLPPLVVAYPLLPQRDTVMKEAPKGRVTLKLKPGPWIIATATTPKLGAKRRYTAKMVVVGSAAQTLRTKGVAPPAPAGVALGEITMQVDDLRFRIDDAFKDDAPRLAKLAPCRPPITPFLGKDPLWQAIRRASVQAGKSGPRPFRGAARAGAASLGAATPAAVFGGTVKLEGGQAIGSFTITDASGQTVWSGTFQAPQGRNALPSLYGQAFTQALKAFCAPSRIQVDVSIGFDATDTQQNETFRGTGVIAARVIGRERTKPDGTVARGDFEYAEEVVWQGRDGAATTVAGPCRIEPISVYEGFNGVGEAYKPPLALAVYRPDNTFLVFLPGAAMVTFIKQRPPDSCSGTGAVRAFFLNGGTQPHQIVVPKLGQAAELTGQATIGRSTTTWSTSVTITRLPSLPPA